MIAVTVHWVRNNNNLLSIYTSYISTTISYHITISSLHGESIHGIEMKVMRDSRHDVSVS